MHKIVTLPKWFFLFGCIAIILIFYGWIARASELPADPPRDWYNTYYNSMADAFRAGQLHLLIDPLPDMLKLQNPYDPAQNKAYRLHCASLYRDKYYLYWGPTPVLLFYLPWKWLSGKNLQDYQAATIFAGGGLLCLFVWALTIMLKVYRRAKWFDLAAIIAIIGFGNLLGYLLSRVMVWEISVLGGFFWATAALLCLTMYLLAQRQPPWLLCLAALCQALAFTSRINYIFSSIMFIVPLYLAWQRRQRTPNRPWKPFLRRFWAIALPMLAAVMGLFIYNYQRFGKITELGVTYQLDNPGNQLAPQYWSWANYPYNAYIYAFTPCHISPIFPFIHPGNNNPGRYIPAFIKRPARNGYLYGWRNIGIFPAMPFYLCLFIYPLALIFRRRKRIAPADADTQSGVSIRPLFAITALALLPNILTVIRMDTASLRYTLDLLVYLLPLACLCYFQLRAMLAMRVWARRALQFFVFVAACAGIATNVALSMHGESDFMQDYNPARYTAIRDRCDAIPSLVSTLRHKIDARVDLNGVETPAALAQVPGSASTFSMRIFSPAGSTAAIFPHCQLHGPALAHASLIMVFTPAAGPPYAGLWRVNAAGTEIACVSGPPVCTLHKGLNIVRVALYSVIPARAVSLHGIDVYFTDKPGPQHTQLELLAATTFANSDRTEWRIFAPHSGWGNMKLTVTDSAIPAIGDISCTSASGYGQSASLQSGSARFKLPFTAGLNSYSAVWQHPLLKNSVASLCLAIQSLAYEKD